MTYGPSIIHAVHLGLDSFRLRMTHLSQCTCRILSETWAFLVIDFGSLIVSASTAAYLKFLVIREWLIATIKLFGKLMISSVMWIHSFDDSWVSQRLLNKASGSTSFLPYLASAGPLYWLLNRHSSNMSQKENKSIYSAFPDFLPNGIEQDWGNIVLLPLLVCCFPRKPHFIASSFISRWIM